MGFLRVNKNLCTGCRICETACSIAKDGLLNKARSRVRVYKAQVVKLVVRVCVHCKKPKCAAVCPEGAIYKENNIVRIDHSLCSKCGKCTEVCDRIFLSPEDGKILICDICGACIEACPEHAMEIV